MKILFICKYNRFRSKFAEAYFIKQNKKIQAESAGIIKMDVPLSPEEKERNNYIKEKFNISINGKSRGVSSRLLKKQDKIIVVADDIPKKVFNGRWWKDKVEIWNVPDEKFANKENIRRSAKIMIKKINELIKKNEN